MKLFINRDVCAFVNVRVNYIAKLCAGNRGESRGIAGKLQNIKKQIKTQKIIAGNRGEPRGDTNKHKILQKQIAWNRGESRGVAGNRGESRGIAGKHCNH